jgi:hypothetical protein
LAQRKEDRKAQLASQYIQRLVYFWFLLMIHKSLSD